MVGRDRRSPISWVTSTRRLLSRSCWHTARQRLIVEVDGRYHERRRCADARRDRMLRRLGYRVLRLDAELVVSELPKALATIRAALGEGE